MKTLAGLGMIRFALVSSILLAVICGVLYGALLWDNNRAVAPLSESEIAASLSGGVKWLERHEDHVLDIPNPILWWMIQRSAAITGDQYLQTLFRKYDKRYLRHNNMWYPLFHQNSWVPVRYEDLAGLPYYNLHFIYALVCDSELGKRPEIAAQNDPVFCDSHPFRPACVTHQLMGIRLLQRSKCGDANILEQSVSRLQERIEWQLTYDPRVVDVYLQRVLMLLESGAGARVKPVWLRRIKAAQTESGGWTGFHGLLPIGGSYQFGFTSGGMGVRKPEQNFHATAQGVFIMSMLTAASRQDDSH